MIQNFIKKKHDINVKKSFRTYEGRRPILMVHDPELLKSVFVKNHQDFAN